MSAKRTPHEKWSNERKKAFSDRIKGEKHPMFGKHHSEETKKKIGEKSKGRFHSEETRKKMSETHKRIGNKPPLRPKGFKCSPEIRKKMSGRKGELSANWKGGITPINKQIRRSPEYKLWRQAVYERDNWTCVWCKQRGGKLQADHIKPFAYYPELRFAIDNGRTLCVDCHKKTDTYGWKGWHYFIQIKD